MAHSMPHDRRPISLALQGGGSFGAFTWGVLDRLLEQDALALDMASGASAGAVNAVALAAGMLDGDRAGARRKLARIWERLSHPDPLRAGSLVHAAAATMTATLERFASPYQFNPLQLNPLRDVLSEEIDFAALRAASPIRLLVSATRVRDGHPRLFDDTEITLDAVLASACLPFLQQAVEIDGEAYWDGGYSANPPLRQLVLDTAAEEILLVQLLPDSGAEPPHFSFEISRRVRELGFNASLLHELDAVQDLRRGCAGRLFPSALCRKLGRLRLHRIAAVDALPSLGRESPLDTSWPFLLRLKEAGQSAAEAWLAQP
jgi:NTE family protein